MKLPSMSINDGGYLNKRSTRLNTAAIVQMLHIDVSMAPTSYLPVPACHPPQEPPESSSARDQQLLISGSPARLERAECLNTPQASS